jgi:hypothetical protein
MMAQNKFELLNGFCLIDYLGEQCLIALGVNMMNEVNGRLHFLVIVTLFKSNS